MNRWFAGLAVGVSLGIGSPVVLAPASGQDAAKSKKDRVEDRDAAPEIARGLALTIEGFTLQALARPSAVAIAANGLGSPGGVFGNASRTGGQGAGAAASGSITGGSSDLTGGTTIGAGNANRTGGSGAGSGAGQLTGASAGAGPVVSPSPGNMRVTGISYSNGRSADLLRGQATRALNDGENLLKQFSPDDGPVKRLHTSATQYADRVRSIARLIGQRGGQGDYDVSTMALLNHAVYQGIHASWLRHTPGPAGKNLSPLADSLEAESKRTLSAIAEGVSGESDKEIARNALAIIGALREIDDQAAKSAPARENPQP